MRISSGFFLEAGVNKLAAKISVFIGNSGLMVYGCYSDFPMTHDLCFQFSLLMLHFGRISLK